MNPIERWEGVGVNGDGCVTDLNLVRNNLHGRIPAEPDDLANLNILNLGDNRLSGAIPDELRNLTSLDSIFL